MKFNLLIICLILQNLSVAQSTHNFYLKGGLNFINTKETRFQSNFRNGFGVNTALGYDKLTEKAIHRMSILFAFTQPGKGNVSFSNVLQPELRYEYLRHTKYKNLAIGGYADIGTILAIRGGNWVNDNVISFCIWSSLGVSSQYEKPIKLGSKNLTWQTQFSLPLATYLVRPSYTFPYTDNYLQNEVFQFGTEGLAQKIITGGKFAFWDKFLNIKFQTGLMLPSINQKWIFGLQYEFNYLQTQELKPLFQSVHQINFIIKKHK
jgi:hypothetical protein